ncbi:MAG: asparagine synthetase B [Armatimonadetes bacterium]|nr:asparagine synthetase B [Armatimonadota bacterium]
MPGIGGIFRRDGGPVSESSLGALFAAIPEWTPGESALVGEGPIGLGQARGTGMQPALPHLDTDAGRAFVAAGRLDNRPELAAELRLQGSRPSDHELMRLAWLRWGEDCPLHLHGDWSLAAWRRDERRLFVARDRLGITSLYYRAGAGVFAFASSRAALLALDLGPLTLDELFVAQVLVTWPSGAGERTPYHELRRLPPAHCLTVTPDRLEVRRYWRLEDTPEQKLSRREDYVAGFREVFDRAVADRLADDGNGVTLSGGLDSSSVTVTAAKILAERGQRLTAFTSVPVYDTRPFVGARFGDELPFARATVRHAGNVDHVAVDAAGSCPIQAIRRQLAESLEPGHAAGNYYWMQAVSDAARERGCRVLLTGQLGNAGISWTGDPHREPLFAVLRRSGWRRAVGERVKRALPPTLARAWLRRGQLRRKEVFDTSAVHPELARRLDLLERLLADPEVLPARSALAMRLRILRPADTVVGDRHAESAAAAGVPRADPTADARVLEYCLAVPDHIFRERETGLDRWLIRAAMAGRLPDEVRLNRNRGRQAGDLVPRLRDSAAAVEAALDEIEAGRGAEFVSLPRMRRAWEMIRTADTPRAFALAITVLTRGIMAGLFCNAADDPLSLRSNGTCT